MHPSCSSVFLLTTSPPNYRPEGLDCVTPRAGSRPPPAGGQPMQRPKQGSSTFLSAATWRPIAVAEAALWLPAPQNGSQLLIQNTLCCGAAAHACLAAPSTPSPASPGGVTPKLGRSRHQLRVTLCCLLPLVLATRRQEMARRWSSLDGGTMPRVAGDRVRTQQPVSYAECGATLC